MIAIKRTLAVVVASVVTLSAAAGQTEGRNDGSRSIQLTEAAVVSGVKLLPGAYTLSWTGAPRSEEVRISIARGRSVLATGTGRWIASSQPSPYEALVYHEGAGAKALAEIRFKQSADAIRLDAGASSVDAAIESSR